MYESINISSIDITLVYIQFPFNFWFESISVCMRSSFILYSFSIFYRWNKNQQKKKSKIHRFNSCFLFWSFALASAVSQIHFNYLKKKNCWTGTYTEFQCFWLFFFFVYFIQFSYIFIHVTHRLM